MIGVVIKVFKCTKIGLWHLRDLDCRFLFSLTSAVRIVSGCGEYIHEIDKYSPQSKMIMDLRWLPARDTKRR